MKVVWRLAAWLLFFDAVSLVAAEKAPPPPTATVLTFPGAKASLDACLYKPEGNGPFPVIIWNHGSKADLLKNGPASRFDAMASLFVRYGYVVFIPDRSIKIMRFDTDPENQEETAIARLSALEIFDINHADLVAAMDWLKKQPYVDTNRFAMVGYSSGAVQSIFEADKYPGFRGCVAFTPNALIWTQSWVFRDMVTTSVRRAKVPIFIIQAQNDFNLDVSISLGKELMEKGKPNRMMVYPPHGKSQKEANLFVLTGADVWGKDVLLFLADVMK